MQQKADIIYTDHSSRVRYPSRPSPGRRSRNSSFDEADADDEPLLSASPAIKPANGHSTAYPSPSQSPEPQLPGLSSPPPTLWYLLSGLLQHNYGLTALLLALLLVALPPYLVHLHYTDTAVPAVDPLDSSSALHSFHPTDYLPKTVDPVLPVTTRDSRSDAPSSAFIASASVDRTHLAKPFAAIDAAFTALHRWPRVDLLVRTFHGSAMFLPLLFQSIDAFWPHNIGRCLIVADAFSETDEKVLAYRHLIPDWCELHYESVPPEMIHNGRWTMQWSNFWADNYTTPDAQFVAIADTDSFFTHKVTPDMYFDARGRVIHVLHPNYQRQFWDKDTLWWLGTKDEMVAHNAGKGWTNDALLNELYPLNFMQNLPQIYPVEAFAAFRDYTMVKHAKDGATLPYFDALNAHFLRTAYGNPSQFCLLGNFLGFFSPQHIRDKVSLVLSDNRQLPAGATRVERAHQLVLRPTMHMPYTDIYNTGQLFPKIVCDGQRFDYTKMYHLVGYFMWVQMCQLQSAVRPYNCTVNTEDATRHMHEAVLYATPHSIWDIADGEAGHRLMYERVYLPRQRWLRGAVRAVVEGGVQGGMTYFKQFADHVAFDLWWVRQKDPNITIPLNPNITRPFEGDPLPAPH